MHFLPQGFLQASGRGDLNDFLIMDLYRAVPFIQMNCLTHGIRQDLHLNMAGPLNQFFHKNVVVAEGCHRLAPTAF